MRRAPYVFAFGILLSGCRTFTPPIEWPVFEQHAQGRVNAFSVIPSRRMVIVKSGELKNGAPVLICAEASADVADNLTSTLAASLAAAGPSTGQDKAASASAAVSKALETSAQFLFKRTQGVQLYRDAMYHLCQARMNGFITDTEYKERATALIAEVVPLIKMELPLLQQAQSVNSPKADEKPKVEGKEKLPPG
ncbi:MAG: hypothetical protein ACJ76N_22880 [Thermoanaerobaculia bacterium]